MSESKLHGENLQKLIEVSRADNDALEFINDCIKSFEAYHASIMEMEFWLRLYDHKTLGREAYEDGLVSRDKARTSSHNAVLSSLRALNRMAERSGVEPIYDGMISEERPYRRLAANAVLAYLEEMIQERR